MYILIALIPITILISLKSGYKDITYLDLLRIIFGGGTVKENLIIVDFRLPRIIIAMLVGIGFSLSGCVLQGITKNPLSDPGLLGINAGAGFVVVIFIVMAGTLSFSSIFLLPFFSFIGAGITGAIIYKLSTNKFLGVEPIRLVLNGVAIQAGINSIMILIILKLDKDQHDFLARWQAGSIWNSNWKLVVTLLPWIVLGFIAVMLMARNLDILALGESISKGLGMHVVKEKRKLLFTAIALAAASVAVSGSISFVGLIGPHLSRKLVGPKHKILLPASGLVGALLVLIADIIARTIIEPAELPTGIVVSVIGAPYFLFLLMKNRKVKKEAT
ncbi:MAG: iron ABC transporter permease [Firmicutes bacterium]|nr:iron ABC transporter permease [Sporosalibacterium faouarense]MTI47576.1 iron ABC transporter permease [Bacillota bacterium]